MDNLQLRFVFDRYKEADNDKKKALLQIEVRQTGTNKLKLFSTGIHLYKNQFSDKNGFTCKNHDNAAAITGKAVKMFRQIEAFTLSDACKAIDDVKKWDKNDPATTSVIAFMWDALKRRHPTDAILEHHSILIRQLEAFGKFHTFADVTYENISDFDAHLRQTITSQPVIYKRHCAFKSYIVDAVNRGLCKSNPYLQFKVV